MQPISHCFSSVHIASFFLCVSLCTYIFFSVLKIVQFLVTRKHTTSEKKKKRKREKKGKKKKLQKQGIRWQPCCCIYLISNVSIFSVTSISSIVCVHSVIDGISVFSQFLTMTLFNAMIMAGSRGHHTAS